MGSVAHTWDFDVAISYAWEDRQYVGNVARLLTQRGLKIFYDEYMATELWGSDLYVVLDEVYRKRARFALVFVSHDYVSKPWARHERRSVEARALFDAETYLLPVQLDGSELPGLPPTVAYVDARSVTADHLVDMVVDRVRQRPGSRTAATPVFRVPRSREQERELLAHRPTAWEYLYYAGVLWRGREALAPKWRDHEIGYARRLGCHLDLAGAVEFLGHGFADIMAIVQSLHTIFEPGVWDTAFGALGEPGDPDRIEHLAQRLIGSYEELMDVAAHLRGVGVPARVANTYELAARLTNQPLVDIRAYVDTAVETFDRMPELLAAGTPPEIELVLHLGPLDDRLVAEFDRQYQDLLKPGPDSL